MQKFKLGALACAAVLASGLGRSAYAVDPVYVAIIDDNPTTPNHHGWWVADVFRKTMAKYAPGTPYVLTLLPLSESSFTTIANWNHSQSDPHKKYWVVNLSLGSQGLGTGQLQELSRDGTVVDTSAGNGGGNVAAGPGGGLARPLGGFVVGSGHSNGIPMSGSDFNCIGWHSSSGGPGAVYADDKGVTGGQEGGQGCTSFTTPEASAAAAIVRSMSFACPSVLPSTDPAGFLMSNKVLLNNNRYIGISDAILRMKNLIAARGPACGSSNSGSNNSGGNNSGGKAPSGLGATPPTSVQQCPLYNSVFAKPGWIESSFLADSAGNYAKLGCPVAAESHPRSDGRYYYLNFEKGCVAWNWNKPADYVYTNYVVKVLGHPCSANEALGSNP